MLLSVRHETTYEYEGVASQVTQVLRLTPSTHDAQELLTWRITRSDGAPISPYLDGFGNHCSFSSRQDPGGRVVVRVAGRVRTRDAGGLVSGAAETLPPDYWLRPTPLTQPSDAVRKLASSAMKGRSARAKLEKLAAAVKERIGFEVGPAYVETSAEAALAAGAGPSQHHAHLLIAAARASDTPARYVSGYVLPERSSDAPFASHAWTEVWIEDVGWVGLDGSRGAPIGESHVRLAIGLDYRQAAPISGFWRGAGLESMSVDGVVEALESGQ